MTDLQRLTLGEVASILPLRFYFYLQRFTLFCYIVFTHIGRVCAYLMFIFIIIGAS